MRIILLLLIFSLPLSMQAASHATESLHLEWMDKNISPALNFYQYANGNWQKAHPIPPEYATWAVFSVLEKETLEKIHGLLQTLSHVKNAKPGSLAQKVGDFYYSGMDVKTINEVRTKPLTSDFQKIDAMERKEDLVRVIAALHLIGVDCLFGFDSMTDFKASDWMIGVLTQGGLGLPDRDYYLKENPKFEKIRAAYVQHIAKMFELMGETPQISDKSAHRVMMIETALAKASMSQIEQRDPLAVYHMMSLRELHQLSPVFDWHAYFKAMGVSSLTRLNVAMPSFFKAMNGLLESVSLEDWKIYLRWQLLDGFSPWLSDDFVNEKFRMNQVLYGMKKMKPRWIRVVNTENGALGFAIGKLYVEKYFSEETKKEVQTMVNNLRNALEKNIKQLTWMSQETKKRALKKLELMRDRVGYPNQWWDYSTLTIDRGPYVLNVRRANQFLVKRELDKIGKKVDIHEWAMTPQTINAYYDPSKNEINLTAAILQPPFFDPKAPKALNYGAIGFVIGHELTHGFDDQGAKFDGHGNLKDWWAPEDLKKFKAATACLISQFSSYQVGEGISVQGPLVVGEAAADLGGAKLALHAFLATPAGKSTKTIDGLTPIQQFFLGMAHVWAGNIRPEQLQNQVMVDPHPPMSLRVNGTLSNMPAFWEAFQVTTPGLMRQSTPCMVW